MTSYWKYLLSKGLISDEKYRRLTREGGFTPEERYAFINRQLVETRQSTKAVATLLKEMFPDTEIVYVKAGLVSDFRQSFGLMKSRTVNDLHHAKDAYLNIVAGNVYNSFFNKGNPNFSLSNYNIKVKEFFTHDITVHNKVIWKGSEDIGFVKKILANNHIHYTNYPYCKKGELFDLQPVKAGKNDQLVPLKKGLDPAKYGGYNRITATYFILVKFCCEKKTAKSITEEKDVMFMPVDLMFADQFEKDENFAIEYTKETVEKIIGRTITNVDFPLGKRKIKVRTLFSFDGFYAFIRGKSDGGKRLLFSSANSIYFDAQTEEYIKRIDKLMEKLKKAPDYNVDSEFDKITSKENVDLYEKYCQKCLTNPAKIFFDSYYTTLVNGYETFKNESLKKQAICLSNIILLFKTGRAGTVDMSVINEGKQFGTFRLQSKLSNISKNCSDIRIVDVSASGLHIEKSENLFNFL